jgi:deoxyribose-phosphate aldolase
MVTKEIVRLGSYIEHTLLNPDATTVAIEKICKEAQLNQFKAICIPPYFVKTASIFLKNTAIPIKTVVGYPMGYNATSVKVEEVKRAINDGVDIIEMVVNIAAIKDGHWSYVYNDIDSVSTAARLKSKLFCIILETGLLNPDEIIRLCNICRELDVDGIKNSTGVNAKGVSVDMLLFLKEHAAGIPLIAAGGIHDQSYAFELIQTGASSIATSSGIQLINQLAYV